MRFACTAVAALLLSAFSWGALASAPADTLGTEAKVSFKEAIYFVNPELEGMDIDLGEHPLPSTSRDTLIYTDENKNTLRVCDARETAGEWSVSGVLGVFMNGEKQFTAEYLDLHNPTSTSGITLTVVDGVVSLRATPAVVMQAETGLARNYYDLTIEGRIELCIGAIQAASVEKLPYKAAITWTLTTGP